MLSYRRVEYVVLWSVPGLEGLEWLIRVFVSLYRPCFRSWNAQGVLGNEWRNSRIYGVRIKKLEINQERFWVCEISWGRMYDCRSLVFHACFPRMLVYYILHFWVGINAFVLNRFSEMRWDEMSVLHQFSYAGWLYLWVGTTIYLNSRMSFLYHCREQHVRFLSKALDCGCVN